MGRSRARHRGVRDGCDDERMLLSADPEATRAEQRPDHDRPALRHGLGCRPRRDQGKQAAINADDPNQGIIETATNQFTLAEADCGQLKDIGGKHAAEPDRAATAVFFFKVRPAGHESSTVSVQATFSAPLYVPLHPPRAVQCVSRGKAEARLLDQVAEEAAAMHRPTFAKPSN